MRHARAHRCCVLCTAITSDSKDILPRHPWLLLRRRDGARHDEDGYIWVMGRVDDVLNVSGHRLSTMEVESALVSHQKVAEAAVVGFPHEIKGEGICCFVTLKTAKEMTL